MNLNVLALNLCLKIIFSIIFIIFIMYIPGDFLWDRYFYIYYYAYDPGKIIKSYDNIKDLLFNDYVFLKINYILGGFFTPKKIVDFILFFCLVLYQVILIKVSKNWFSYLISLLLSLIILPMLHLEVVAIRQFLAINVILLALVFFRSNFLIFLMFLIASTIHNSMFLFVFIFIMDFVLLKRFSYRKAKIIELVILVIIAVSYMFLVTYLGLRQGEFYSSYTAGVGGGGFILALILLFYLIKYEKISNFNLYNFTLNSLLVFLSFYFFVNGTVSARLMESMYPAFILLFSSKLRNKEIAIFFILIIAYGYIWGKGGGNTVFETPMNQVYEYYLD